jgi:uncharacterized membrane protein
MSPHLETPAEEHVVHEFFLVSVILKGLISLAEVVVGVAVLLIPPQTIISLTLTLLNHLPIASVQAKLIAEVSTYTSGTAFFISLYLLSRGLVKVGLVWGLLKGKLIAYPLSLGVLALLVAYQTYQIITPPFSLIVFAVTLFDLVVMYFVYREWKIVLRHTAGLH